VPGAALIVIDWVWPASTFTLMPSSLIEKLCGATPTLATEICVGVLAGTWNEFGVNLNSTAWMAIAAAPEAAGSWDSAGDGEGAAAEGAGDGGAGEEGAAAEGAAVDGEGAAAEGVAADADADGAADSGACVLVEG
jgi:hypothetical protein